MPDCFQYSHYVKSCYMPLRFLSYISPIILLSLHSAWRCGQQWQRLLIGRWIILHQLLTIMPHWYWWCNVNMISLVLIRYIHAFFNNNKICQTSRISKVTLQVCVVGWLVLSAMSNCSRLSRKKNTLHSKSNITASGQCQLFDFGSSKTYKAMYPTSMWFIAMVLT